MILYHLIKFYIKIGLFLFYKKISIIGEDNIPKKGPILFVANHQNAMMDPLVVATSTNTVMYFLARASAFKNKIAAKLLSAINAIAIYRVRDGVNSKFLNKAVFNHCSTLLSNGESILIFPEGSHNIVRKVRPLRAGFTRIAFDYLTKNENKDLIIIPIGLNYNNTINYAKSLHIIYGKPISSAKYFDKNNINKSTGDLIKVVHKKLAELTVYIDDSENYDSIISNLAEDDFLTPTKTNNILKNISTNIPKPKKSKSKNIFYLLMMFNSIFPFLIWKWIHLKIQAIEFISTAKFSLGITAFPIFYILQSFVVNHFFGNFYAFLYLIISFLLVFISTKTR